jgi:hypothetical protein
MKKDVGQLVSEIYALLKEQDKEDNIKILSSVSTLLDINDFSILNGQLKNNGNPPPAHLHGSKSPNENGDVKSFFDHKVPQNKGEEFAVAAKFRIDNNQGEEHTREDLKSIIKGQAKRVFDDGNFSRDISNAIRQAKFFIGGEKKGYYVLSAFGEKFVNALPDRTSALQIKKAKGGKKAKKKVAKKNTKK